MSAQNTSENWRGSDLTHSLPLHKQKRERPIWRILGTYLTISVTLTETLSFQSQSVSPILVYASNDHGRFELNLKHET